MKKVLPLVSSLAVAALVLAGCAADEASDSSSTTTTTTETESSTETTATAAVSLLESVQANGAIRCGTRDALPGFAVLDTSGDHVGFDSDFCRVIAAGILGDAAAAEMVDLETADRFTALQNGSIDVLVRNTTWTMTRDGGEAATFLQTTFYDGQGVMVSADSGYDSVSDMQGAVVCVAKGTTTEGNAALESSRLGLNWEVRAFDEVDLILAAFLAGQCDGWSSDVSQLTGLRSAYPDGSSTLVILPEVFSKEPLGPAVLDGDTAWASAVEWAILATIQAEEFGLTSANVDGIRSSTTDVGIQRFLGVEIETDEGTAIFDPGLGLPTDFAYQIVKQVGNYGEIFDRHLAPLGLERGVNSLWTDGGLLYSPPFR